MVSYISSRFDGPSGWTCEPRHVGRGQDIRSQLNRRSGLAERRKWKEVQGTGKQLNAFCVIS